MKKKGVEEGVYVFRLRLTEKQFKKIKDVAGPMPIDRAKFIEKLIENYFHFCYLRAKPEHKEKYRY